MGAEIEKRNIEITPDICGGKPRIGGTRIRVSQIVVHTEQGASADELVTSYPTIRLSDVYDALAYYRDHQEDIDEELREGDELVGRLKEKFI